MRLSPRDPVIGLRHMEIGFAELGLGHFDAAAEDYHKSIDTGFVNWIPYVGLALAHSLDGKTEEAKTDLAEARRHNPKLTVQWLKDHMPSGRAGIGDSAQGRVAGRMSETRKIAAILVADVVGYSRLAGADEDRTLSRLRGLRSDLIDPAIDAHHGRIVKRTGDGILIEFRSVVDAVRCAIEVQNGLIERNAGLPPERRIEFRVGIHLGDVVEESDGDLMGDGVNIAARLEGIAKPGAICLSEDAYRQVSGRLDMEVTDLGPTKLKNIEKPIRAYSLEVGKPALAKPARAVAPPRRSIAALLVVGVAALIAIAAGAWHFRGVNRAPPAEAAQLSLVVLPFSNLSGDASQDYLGDVLTEELTTSLSRLPGSFVVSRTTAFSYRGKAMDVKQIGKELGVRYVLEGSAQKSGTRVRVDAQLIDAASGAHLWADQFDADETDLLTMQDEIVTRLARALQVELTAAEASRVARAHPENPDAEELALQCEAAYLRFGLPAERNAASLCPLRTGPANR